MENEKTISVFSCSHLAECEILSVCLLESFALGAEGEISHVEQCRGLPPEDVQEAQLMMDLFLFFRI